MMTNKSLSFSGAASVGTPASGNTGARVALVLFLCLYTGAALAGGMLGGGADADPLGSGMCKVVDLLTGKWAFGLSVVALLGVGAAFLFGVEMSEVMKKLVTLVTAVAFVVFGGSILKFIFPTIVGC